MRPIRHRAGGILVVLGLFAWAQDGHGPPQAALTFPAEIERLSEPGGYFDTDNLISNELSYLEVIPSLEAAGVRSGAYIGVGPDQNFSYIAHIRPSVAYIIDIRRDNLLLHLLFKSLFAEANTRVEYLCLLTGRSPPSDLEGWRSASLNQIVTYVDRSLPAADAGGIRRRLNRRIDEFQVPLSPKDRETIDRFHRTFIGEGLGLRFNTHGRAPRPYYPTFRDLLLAADAKGQLQHYLASEEDFQFIRWLQAQDAVIPVVGDVAGPSALAAIGQAVADRQKNVMAFYISNVEFYLYGARHDRFLDNVKQLPRTSQSVMIRSVFTGRSSRTMIERLDDFVR